FLLGASRGSIFALILPFLFLLYKSKSIKKKIGLTLFIVVSSAVIVYLSNKFESSLILRLLNIQQDIESGSSSAARLDIWHSSFQQFLNNPLFGNSLESEKYGMYPHNIFLEVLISTGIIGSIPFLILVYNGFKGTFFIIKNHIEYSWVPVIFLQAFAQNMFSSGLYMASRFFVSIALVIILVKHLKRQHAKTQSSIYTQ
ncbi:MAG: O-antigen ligase family protein, partial [Bacteroidota bacterium]